MAPGLFWRRPAIADHRESAMRLQAAQAMAVQMAPVPRSRENRQHSYPEKRIQTDQQADICTGKDTSVAHRDRARRDLPCKFDLN
jgi:hypothetical protein